MRRLALRIALLLCLGAQAAAGDSSVYLAINPGAALSFVNTGFVVHSILPTALFGQEAGVAVGLGLNRGPAFTELRISVGNSNAFYLLLQAQVSWNWFFGETAGWLAKGPYVGAALRSWDLVQVHAGFHSLNAAPLVNLGWWLELGRFFVDLRLSQVFVIASWSSIPHSIPGIALVASPLPGISPWLPIGLVQVGIRL